MNFNDYLTRQMNEDRRAFIIHFPAMRGKTKFARRVREVRQDVYLLDMQEYFSTHDDLPSIRQLNSDALWDFLLRLNVPEPVILVDNPDFLLNTWKPAEKENFLHKIKVALRSPADTAKTFVFMIQTDNILSDAQIVNSYGDSRVLPLDAFNAL